MFDPLIRNLVNIPGWRTNRKIVVFESDDWGSIRMRSKTDRDELSRSGFSFEGQPFNMFDSLESNDDLSALFEVLTKYKDSTDRHPVFTAVTIVGNPDFEKIRKSDYQEYYWESFTETLRKYPLHNKVYQLYREGVEKRLFVPVFHGREHLNVRRWLKKLQEGNKSVRVAFDHGITGIHLGINNEYLGDFQAAFDLDNPADIDFMQLSIKEGLETFEKLWDFKARYFVPSNGPFNNSLEAELKTGGVEYLLAERKQKEPLGNNCYKTHFHYIGQKNALGQTYLTRNGFFEPSITSGNWHIQPVEKCLKSIERAFRWGKPATISSHRVNYIGFIEPGNREKSLRLLNELLKQIINKWPDVEFMTSTELGSLIKKKH